MRSEIVKGEYLESGIIKRFLKAPYDYRGKRGAVKIQTAHQG
jgi:hypothetical protein